MEISNTPAWVNGTGSGYKDAGSYNDSACWMSLSHQIAELRREIGETECGIKETIHNQSLSMGKDFCDLNKNVADHSHRNVIEILTNRSALKDGICLLDKSIMENRNILAEKIDRETDLLKLQLGNFERRTDENFCSVRTEIKDSERRIKDQLTTDKLDEKNDVIARLRSKNERHEDRFIIANEINGLKTMINSVEQNQRFSSKTVQFGAGNVAIPTQTANQA